MDKYKGWKKEMKFLSEALIIPLSGGGLQFFS